MVLLLMRKSVAVLGSLFIGLGFGLLVLLAWVATSPDGLLRDGHRHRSVAVVVDV